MDILKRFQTTDSEGHVRHNLKLIAAVVLAVGLVSERHTRDALAREVEGRLLSLARSLALAGGDALLSDFPELTLPTRRARAAWWWSCCPSIRVSGRAGCIKSAANQLHLAHRPTSGKWPKPTA